MTDVVLVSVLNGIEALSGIALSRWMSHRENAQSAKQINEIHVMVNNERTLMREDLVKATKEIVALRDMIKSNNTTSTNKNT